VVLSIQHTQHTENTKREIDCMDESDNCRHLQDGHRHQRWLGGPGEGAAALGT
jgi:hypothetical protein